MKYKKKMGKIIIVRMVGNFPVNMQFNIYERKNSSSLSSFGGKWRTTYGFEYYNFAQARLKYIKGLVEKTRIKRKAVPTYILGKW